MSDPALLSILHLSDFHFTKRKIRDQRVVVDALIKDLETLCIGHRRPDIVLFTGDLVNAGGDDRHEEAYDFLLSRVAQATGCSDERIFIVPGNHDLSRKVVEEKANTHREWHSLASDMDGLNRLYGAGGFRDVAAQKFEAYHDLERYLAVSTERHRNEFVTVHHIAALNVDIVIINTSMLSTGGLTSFEKDEGLLAVPEHAVLDALDALTEGSFRIFATHHPFGMLSENASRTLSQLIEANAHMHLFGHMHDPQARNVVGFKGQLFSDQAGAVFTQRKGAYIGFSLISVEPNKGYYETHLHTYFDDRKAFDDALDVVPQGRFHSSHEAAQFWRKIATPVDDKVLRAHLSGACLDDLNAEMDAGADREIHERFVPPPMKRTFVQPVIGDDSKGIVETPVSFEDLVSGDDNVILYAAAEYGRTTVLKQMAYRHMADAESMRLPRLPIIVDFADVKQNTGSLLKVVRSRMPELPQGVDAESVLKLGHACVMFDDVVFTDDRRMAILREFVANYPKLRYILSSAKNSASQYGSHVNPEMPIHFDFVELCVLRVREMRQLVVKFNGCTDVDSVLDRLQSEFREINLPFTAANGSILMSIYETQSGFRPINRSVLIEQFIDAMLKKAAVEQSRRETFDYANKTALLAHVAAWMAKENNYIPSAEAVREVMKGYIDKMGLIAPIDSLMNEFLTARILVRRADDRLSFRYRAVLEYFIALQMGSDPAFKAWVMEEERYLTFVNEIQYYAGRLRNDSGLVDEIGQRFTAILSSIEQDKGPFDIVQIANLKLPANDSDVAADMLSRQLAAPMSQEERDEELEAELPVDVENRQEVFRPKVVDPGQKLIVALFLYSGVVKNMELIDDASKRGHLAELWRGWSTFLYLSLTIVPEIAKHRKFRINGVLYELNAPVSMSDGELTRIISLEMPVGITRMISGTLGTEKLEKQIVEPELDAARQPLIFELLRTALIADLRLSATPHALATALDVLRNSPYLREALIMKIADLRRMDRIAELHLKTIASPLAGALADLKGGSKKVRDDEKRRQLTKLRNEGLMLRIKRLRDKD
ncbi:MAG: metallophosphoesterase [Novosphingobium sp.]